VKRLMALIITGWMACISSQALAANIPLQTYTPGIDGHPVYFYKSDGTSGHAAFDPSKGVIIALHGGGGNGSNMDALGGSTDGLLRTLAQEQGVAIILPDGDPMSGSTTQKQWNDCRTDASYTTDDVSYLQHVIAAADTIFATSTTLINKKKVYLYGHSNGSMMAMRMALEAPVATTPTPIAAIATTGSALPVTNDSYSGSYECKGYTAPFASSGQYSVPIMMIKGSADIRAAAGKVLTAPSGTLGTGYPAYDTRTYCLYSDPLAVPVSTPISVGVSTGGLAGGVSPYVPSGARCGIGGLYSGYNSLAFWQWKNGIAGAAFSPTNASSAIVATPTAVTSYSDLSTNGDVPTVNSTGDCATAAPSGCDNSSVKRYDYAGGRVVMIVVSGGGHYPPGIVAQSSVDVTSSGWKNLDRMRVSNTGTSYFNYRVWDFFQLYSTP